MLKSKVVIIDKQLQLLRSARVLKQRNTHITNPN